MVCKYNVYIISALTDGKTSVRAFAVYSKKDYAHNLTDKLELFTDRQIFDSILR